MDTDLGADDLFALLMVKRHLGVDGVSLSFGCTTLAQAARNADGASAAFGALGPVHRGAACALLGAVETAERILGPAGILDRGERLPTDAPTVTEPDAVSALVRWLGRQEPGAATILALGPLTNIAVLALARPDLLPRLHRIVWMGGARGRGNHTPSAEFNAYADPEALAVLVARGAPLVLVDLDACRKVLIREHDVSRLAAAGGPNSRLLASLLGGYLDVALSRGRSAMALYDPVAAAALIDPSLFDVSAIGLDVECAGALTRGRTVVDMAATTPNAQLVDPIDPAGVREVCMQCLEAS